MSPFTVSSMHVCVCAQWLTCWVIIPALLDDWVGNEPNDLLDFVPVDWTIDIALKQYEIFLLVNRYNWLDLLPGGVENTKLAFCGASGHISFGLPFTNYIPLRQMVHFCAEVIMLHMLS